MCQKLYLQSNGKVLDNDCQETFVSENVLPKRKRDRVKERIGNDKHRKKQHRKNTRDIMKQTRENIGRPKRQKKDEINGKGKLLDNFYQETCVSETIPANGNGKVLDNDCQETFVSENVLPKRKRDRVKERIGNNRERKNQHRKKDSVKYKRNAKNFKGKVSIINRYINKTKMNIVSTWKCSQMASLRRKRTLLEKWKRYRNNIISKRYQSRKVKTLADCVNIFNEKTSHGPIYVCTVCLQTWFHGSVSNVSNITWASNIQKATYLECTQHYKSVDGKEWLCNTCKAALKKGQWPKLSVANGMGFPDIPDALKLYGMEERVVSPRLLFFQMRSHFLGRRTRVIGHVVNLAVDVAPTVKILPRTLSDTQTITVRYKRKFEYKKCEFTENIRPTAVWKAADYLLKNSEIYKNENIQLNTKWLDTLETGTDSSVKEIDIFEENTSFRSTTSSNNIHGENLGQIDDCPENHRYDTSNDEICVHSPEQQDTEQGCDTDNRAKLHRTLDSNTIQYHNTSNVLPNTNEDRNIIELDSDDEQDEDFNVIHRDTLLHDPQVTHLDPEMCPSTLTYAPGEGCKPLSIFQDKDVEYLAFPTIFCGQRRKEKKYSVPYSDICKYELRSVDRRVAKNIPNMFFKLKKVQMKSVMAKRSLLMRRCKTKGLKIAVRQVLDDQERAKIVRLDEGYYIFRDIRNSPAYLAKKRREAFAMIRQIGFPSVFISQSAAETKWPELLKALGQTVDNRTYADEEVENMDFETKSRLIRGDSATVVRYFDHRFKVFLNDVVFSDSMPLGHITDYFWRKEFATRGAIHVHWFAYIKDAPTYGEVPNVNIAEFYDKIISCSSDVPGDQKEYVQYQIHRHSKSCRVGKARSCRFSFPRPPMPKTCILEPLACDDKELQEIGKNLWVSVKKQLNSYGLGTEIIHTFNDMLQELNMSYSDYILAVRSTLVRAQFFPERKPCEIRINNYMRQCLHIWRANHDIQPCLNPYAVVEYILSYVTKGQKGMSVQMERACSDAKRGNMDLKESVRHMGNVFLNGVETGQEEAAFLLLQLPMTFMSRDSVFINTSPKNERTFLVKSKKVLEQMDPDSTDIQVTGLIARYAQRPHAMENYCLADFASKVNICKKGSAQSMNARSVICVSDDGTVYKTRKKDRVIRYVNYSKTNNREHHYRERLMLFFPWRDEEFDILSDCNSHEDKYNLHKDKIESIRINYEKFDDDLEQILATTVEYDADDNISVDEQDMTSNMFGFFDPDRDEKFKKYDIGEEFIVSSKRGKLQKKRYETEVDCSDVHMSNDEYDNTMQILNRKQYELCTHVMHQLENNTEQMFIFVEGGAGVGKTVLGRALCETIVRYYKKQPGHIDSGKYILILAPTGMAAYHIKGTTFHTGLHIPVNQITKLTPLSHNERNTLHSHLRNVKFVVIDEISMVGSRLFEKCNVRLQDIFGTKKPFGNKHVIAIGDFYQMKPVLDSYVFKNSGKEYTALAPNVWCEHFKIFSLEEIMRQRDEKTFCQILNRLRKAQCTEEDNKVFQGRVVAKDSSEYRHNVRHILPFRNAVQEHNEQIYAETNENKVTITADDVLCGNPIEKEKVVCQYALKTQKEYSQISGLMRNLHAAVNSVYIVSCNLSTVDGLINGAICTLKYIDFTHSVKENIPSTLWVQFDDVNVGVLQRNEYKQYYTDTIDVSWTPIFTQFRETVVRNSRVIRAQFPLVPAAAVTIHKCQGSTLKNVVLNMDPALSPHLAKNLGLARQFYQHAHYVAASRVSSLEGLQILNWAPHLISVNEEVAVHMEYMNTQRKLQLCFEPLYCIDSSYKCSYINARSLHKHINNVRANHTLKCSDIIMVSETRLMASDTDVDYNIEGFQNIYRHDEPTKQIFRPPHGLAIFVRNGVIVKEIHKLRSAGFEAMYVCLYKVGDSLPVQFISLYASPQIKFQNLIKNIDKLMLGVDLISAKCIILGDFNMKSILPHAENANATISHHMKEQYNIKQFVKCNTTEGGSMLDLCFSNDTNIHCVVTWNHWSDHKIVSAVCLDR